MRIEEKSTKDMSLMEAVKLIRGPKGTPVRITVMRDREDKPIELSILRDVIPMRSVRQHLLAPGIGYVRISNFQSQTSEQLSDALEALEKEGVAQGVVLDLRNNPGGC